MQFHFDLNRIEHFSISTFSRLCPDFDRFSRFFNEMLVMNVLKVISEHHFVNVTMNICQRIFQTKNDFNQQQNTLKSVLIVSRSTITKHAITVEEKKIWLSG